MCQVCARHSKRASVQRHAGEGIEKAFLTTILDAEGALALMFDAMERLSLHNAVCCIALRANGHLMHHPLGSQVGPEAHQPCFRAAACRRGPSPGRAHADDRCGGGVIAPERGFLHRTSPERRFEKLLNQMRRTWLRCQYEVAHCLGANMMRCTAFLNEYFRRLFACALPRCHNLVLCESQGSLHGRLPSGNDYGTLERIPREPCFCAHCLSAIEPVRSAIEPLHNG